MRCEIPVLLRCCCCFPLRYGLLVWAYIKQMFTLLFLAYIIVLFYDDYRKISVWGIVVLSGTILLTILDFVFHVFFIISAHAKDYRKIRIYYRYSIFVFCLSAIFMGMYIGSSLLYVFYRSKYLSFLLWYMILPAMGMTVTLILIQAYLIILVRSEFIKLKNNAQFEFVNNAEEKCTANIDYDQGIPA
ncbi:jg15330 [Pararge aegeria aegeria]|uniref:Jg15330 protein n=1 Tax=Pararge aegeria aegeria TaxID=348720 RepID=A0A8S4RH70_9NEOP|nr:jg15330 [Pararge aegeria aegeria]